MAARLFLSGPMRGYPRLNHDAFDRAAALLRYRGYAVTSPAEMDRIAGIDPDNPETWDDEMVRNLMRYDLSCVITDAAVVTLPGWYRSWGATLEVMVARAVGTPVLRFEQGDGPLVPAGPRALVGLCGYAQSGKDSLAAGMAEYGWHRLAFADRLKDAASSALPRVDRQLVAQCGWTDGLKAQHRPMLQELGAKVRDLRDDAWVTPVLDAMHESPDSMYVVTDVRYPNEADALRSWGGTIVRVERPGRESDGHQSERPDLIKHDLVLRNGGSLDDWAYKAKLLAQSMEYAARARAEECCRCV